MADDDRSLLEKWRWVARRANVAHLRATDAASTRYLWVGGVATVLAAVVSSTVFATLGDSDDVWRVVAGVLALVSAALAGLNTFLRDGERVEMHRSAARRYGGLVRRIQNLLTCAGDAKLCDEIEAIRAEMDAVDSDAPNVPGYVWVWAVDGVTLEQEGVLDDASSHKRRHLGWLRRTEAQERGAIGKAERPRDRDG